MLNNIIILWNFFQKNELNSNYSYGHYDYSYPKQYWKADNFQVRRNFNAYLLKICAYFLVMIELSYPELKIPRKDGSKERASTTRLWAYNAFKKVYQATFQGTVENSNGEEASWKVAWCTEHFSLWGLTSSKAHATLHEPNVGSYFLLCNFSR